MPIECSETVDKGHSPEATEANSVESKFSKIEATVALWFLLLVFGGGGLAAYYLRIGYFPDIDWHESAAYLGALSIIGGWVVVTIGVSVFVPGYIWSEFIVFDPAIQPKLCYHSQALPEPCFRAMGLPITLPFLVLVLLGHLPLMLEDRWVLAAIVAIGVSILAASILVWIGFSRLLQEEARKEVDKIDTRPALSNRDRQSRLIKYVFAFDLSVLFVWFGLFVIKQIVVYSVNPWLMMICTAVVVISNLAVVLEFRKSATRAVLISAGAAVVLLVAGEVLGRPTTLIDRVMARYGFGGTENSTLVLKEEGCALLEGHDISVNRYKLGLCKVTDTAILSRLGNDYFLKAHKKRISMPKAMVVSWSVPE